MKWPPVRRSRLEWAERDRDYHERRAERAWEAWSDAMRQPDEVAAERNRLRSQIQPRCPKTGKMLPKGER